MIFTAQDIVRMFEARDAQHGKIYQAEGRVKEIEIEKNGAHIEASVQGEGARPYRVSVDLRKKGARLTAESVCTCQVGYLCKHAAAALYEAIAEDNRRHERLRRSGQKAFPLSSRLSAWLSAFEKMEGEGESGNRIVYIVETDEAGYLKVVPAIQHRGQNGEWSYPRPQKFEQIKAANAHQRLMDEHDNGIFALAAAAGQTNRKRDEEPDPEIVDLFMRRILETKRAFADEKATRPLSPGKDVEARLDWNLGENRRQKPVLRPARAALRVLLSSAPYYIDEATGEAGPLRCAAKNGMRTHFLSGPALDEKEAAALRKRLEGRETFLPAPYEIRTGGKPLRPEPRVRLADGAGFLSFTYNEEIIRPLDPASHYETRKDGAIFLCKRDFDAEKACLKKLLASGLMQAADAADPRGLRLLPAPDSPPWFWTDFLYRLAPRLREEGFSIAAEDALSGAIVAPDSTDIDAAFTQNGEWWFSLDLGISVDGQRIKLLPILLAMIKRLPSFEAIRHMKDTETCYAPLPDGRTIALPAARVRVILQTLVELFDPKALDKEGRIKISMDLAASFVNLEAITRKRWLGEGHLHQLVEKLGNFAGIEPIAPPKGLKAALRPYQAEGYHWLHFLGSYGLSGILADDMGLGKTVQALAYILSLKERKKLTAPCLIVMPTSLIANWQSESARFAPSLKTLTLHGRERLKRFEDICGVDVVFTTYPLLPRDRDILIEKKWSLIVLDEAQAIKNPAAKMTQAACALQAAQRLCLTGTPVENHLGEAWSLFTFLMPGLLGDHKSFARHYRTPIEKENDVERKELLARRLRPFVLRRLKGDVARELPPKTEIVRRVTLADEQRDLYEAVRHAMNERVREEIAAKGEARSRIVILDALLKLRQTCCDPRLVKLEAARKVKESAKLQELMEMIPTLIEEGRKILLFSQFTSMLDLIKPELKKAEIPYVELRGTTKDRATPIRQFQKGEAPLFLISLKAGGTGLNLTAADTVIHYDPWWNPSVENQATDRAHRIGQDKPVFVYKLIAEGTVEERILELQSKKTGLAAALFGDAPDAAARLTGDDLKWLMG